MTIKAAALLTDRTERRIKQLIGSEIEAGDFQNTVITSSVRRYKRKIDRGTIKRGRPRKKK